MDLQQAWESEAENWARFAGTPGNDQAHAQINLPALTELLPPPGLRTLDVASGEGRLSRHLAALGHRVIGIDGSPTLVRYAAGHDGAPPALVADAARLPFGDGVFDLVIAYMCLHDIDQLGETVAEAARVLRPGGRLCAAIPHPVNSAGSFQEDGAFVIAGSYLGPARYATTIERSGIRLTFHSQHRPIGAYIQALAAAGLLTETIREVGSPDDPRWQRVPLFLHLRAVKPSGSADG